jgi:hypothetical protein
MGLKEESTASIASNCVALHTNKEAPSLTSMALMGFSKVGLLMAFFSEQFY